MIGVDVGGTFTDVVAISNGEIRTVKVSTDVRTTERGVLRGAEEIGVADSAVFNHASTHGLNAIITRRLPKIAFLTTLGHRDILDIGRTWRPVEGLTNPAWRRSYGDANRPLVPRYLRRGIRERLTADGGVLIQLDEDHAREELRILRKCGVEGVAICLINAYVNHHHEERLRQLAHEELGDIPVSISSEVSPLAKEFARASTTVVDVFMRLTYDEYTRRLDSGLKELGFAGDLNFADCAAQLVRSDVAMEHPFRIVFAGPAAGTVSSAHFGDLIGAGNLLCADVGGTSCDISMVTEGRPFVNTTFELEHDLIVNALSNEISSIGAGGGSLVTINAAGELKVGPGSAGADPGPACYGLGGTQPTTTDTCLLMGVIDPDGFAGGRMKLDPDLSRQAFDALDSKLSFDQRVSYAFNIGINNIAEGVVNIAIQHGVDPRDYSLVAFGAAGPMLLPAVLDLVHAAEVIVPPHPGLFSALGLVSSDLVYADSRSAYTLLTAEAAEQVDKVYHSMEERLRERLQEKDRGNVTFVRSFDGRLAGQTWETPFVGVPDGEIDADAIATMVANFHDAYAERSGNRFEALPVQGVTYRVQAVVKADKVEYPTLPERPAGESAAPTRTLQIRYLTDEVLDAGEYQRTDLRAGDRIPGPAVIREPLSTTFLVPGQVATVGAHGELRIRKA
ncbi:hydantoinase/oxoprolinase family protein [Amycolatopsis rubida]|uniref:Hydantoinase/oxoprolinase family protein n=1 Tax=Amycolatopsis rubida TaxID=112413 RepID=A0ABX0C3S7_9PSEU|nr:MULTISPECIES: hydantoinase/oxoprolinase family protein [Amycolatopsis]MYW96268.1 hydantoinase/oxoprolinase family protein [Amycolatopsis rubida]NEC61259.1 hydantoinase/oxoprolinase family protein [Amycolatopsis rubida]OAP24210.1 Acetophenone carboxylase gamma subunit [Amycolatopsis sp. M39]